MKIKFEIKERSFQRKYHGNEKTVYDVIALSGSFSKNIRNGFGSKQKAQTFIKNLNTVNKKLKHFKKLIKQKRELQKELKNIEKNIGNSEQFIEILAEL